MILNSRSRVAVAVLVAALVAPALGAQDAASEMSAEQAAQGLRGAEAMMAAWQAAMTPGAPHEHLAKAAGSWSVTIKAWMDGPWAEPTVSEGTSENTMILGGRVLEQVMVSDMMGMPYKGLGMSGYDNTTGEYWASWLDNMSTGTYVAYGSLDESGVMTMHGEYADPTGGGMVKVRSVVHNEGDDKSVFEWYETREGDQEIMTMEITYIRQTE